jgi:hypothetical protein
MFTIGLVSLLSICFNTLKSQQISNIVLIIRLARLCIANNLYLPLVAALLNAISIGMFMLNVYCIKICLGLVKVNHHHHGPFDQLIMTNPGIILFGLVIFQIFWSHGFIISLSHWMLEVIATFWYYFPVD